MNKIGSPNYLINNKDYLIFVAADIEGEHVITLESNYILGHLQCIIKAVKCYSGDNGIINNTTPQVFTLGLQSYQWRLEWAWNSNRKLCMGLVMYQNWKTTVPIRVIPGNFGSVSTRYLQYTGTWNTKIPYEHHFESKAKSCPFLFTPP